MGKYSNHPCTSLAVCQTTLPPTGSCTCTLPDRTKAACLADQTEMPASTGCFMQPLVCCLNATGSSPAPTPTPTTWFCHHIATESHSSLGKAVPHMPSLPPSHLCEAMSWCNPNKSASLFDPVWQLTKSHCSCWHWLVFHLPRLRIKVGTTLTRRQGCL